MAQSPSVPPHWPAPPLARMRMQTSPISFLGHSLFQAFGWLSVARSKKAGKKGGREEGTGSLARSHPLPHPPPPFSILLTFLFAVPMIWIPGTGSVGQGKSDVCVVFFAKVVTLVSLFRTVLNGKPFMDEPVTMSSSCVDANPNFRFVKVPFDR